MRQLIEDSAVVTAVLCYRGRKRDDSINGLLPLLHECLSTSPLCALILQGAHSTSVNTTLLSPAGLSPAAIGRLNRAPGQLMAHADKPA